MAYNKNYMGIEGYLKYDSPSTFTYLPPSDTLAQISAAAYFNPDVRDNDDLANKIKLYDFIKVNGSDAGDMLVVTGLNPITTIGSQNSKFKSGTQIAYHVLTPAGASYGVGITVEKDIRVVGAKVVPQTTGGGAGNEIQIWDGTNDITNRIDISGTTAKTSILDTTIDHTYWDIDEGSTLAINANGGATPASLVACDVLVFAYVR